ncbi:MULTISPECIES: helix-turn-helix domain-containing protein [Agrobacterium]|uniref:helix-turn-helix domain-containing protein n=1 Tax=Agrobacterium TaxID=357 RepID=UPI001FD8EA26|nr:MULTISPECIES: helix-turn-helix domain-containing protein [Agrobacterium]
MGYIVVYAQFLLSPPQQHEKLDVADEAIVQLLIEGATAKEIAETLGVSPRTLEHRIERLKIRYRAEYRAFDCHARDGSC